MHIYPIQQSAIEGEHHLNSVQCVKLSYFRLSIIIILCISTGFLLAFFFRWFPDLLNNFVYLQIDIDKATHFITSPYKEIVKKNGNNFQFRFLTYKFTEKKFIPIEFSNISMKPLTEEESIELRKEYGYAQMRIPIVSFVSFTFSELSTPFYTLQYICVVVWLIQGFIYFAIVMLSCSLISTLIKYLLLRRSLIRLQQLAAIKQNIKVVRGDVEKIIDVNELVPGDIFIMDRMMVPADCILHGSALLNEATLTGESNPVPKQSGQTLFEGTKVISCTKGTKAQAFRTNYSTIRGQYFRNVLYPHMVTHKFYVQALKFLGWFVIFNVCIAGGTIYIYLDFNTKLIITNIVGTLTWIFPPAMPIFFSITATIALLRLHKLQIIGSNMDKIHISGQVDVCCFDKTGTLTTNELSVVQLWEQENCQVIISCCHHLCKVDEEIYGDVLDIEMVRHSKAQINFESNQVTLLDGNIYTIEKIFEFNSELMSMSVILKNQDKYLLCSKGAPERLDYKHTTQIDEQLQQFVNQGYRVIALAQKQINFQDLNQSREILEKDLNFHGYLVFENKLKADTIQVMRQLIDSRMKCKILSGDNPLTTINTAYEISIAKDIVHLLDVRQDNNIYITPIHRVDNKQQIGQAILFDIKSVQNEQQFAITGDAMNQLKGELQQKIYFQTVVFSRVKPHQKKEAVAMLQMNNHTVAMIGDGSNDCSAIAQADIGVSFSQADASYTAHFSSLGQSIGCIVTILSQGRATASTLSEVFPLYLMLSFLASIAYITIALEGQNYSDFQLLYISFLCYLPIMFTMTFSKALPQITAQLPLDDMYAAPNQLSIYSHLIILSGGLIFAVLFARSNPDHVDLKPEPPINEYIRYGILNSVTVIVALLYSIFIPLMLYASAPFKEGIFKNYAFTILIMVSLFLCICYLYIKETHGFLGLVDFNQEMPHFDIYLGLIMAGTLSFDYLVQQILFVKYPKIKQL